MHVSIRTGMVVCSFLTDQTEGGEAPRSHPHGRGTNNPNCQCDVDNLEEESGEAPGMTSFRVTKWKDE